MYVDLPPLKKTSYIFTFHKEGLFDFKCLQHQPEMAGQIIVLPAIGKTLTAPRSTPAYPTIVRPPLMLSTWPVA